MKSNPKRIDNQIYSHLGKLIEEAESKKPFFKDPRKSNSKELLRTDAQNETIRLSQLQCNYFNRDTLRCDFYRYDYTPIQCPFCPAKVLRDSQSA